MGLNSIQIWPVVNSQLGLNSEIKHQQCLIQSNAKLRLKGTSPLVIDPLSMTHFGDFWTPPLSMTRLTRGEGMKLGISPQKIVWWS